MSDLGANVGHAWVALRFSARGAKGDIQEQLDKETKGVGEKSGDRVGQDLSNGILRAFNKSDTGRKVNESLSKGFTARGAGIAAASAFGLAALPAAAGLAGVAAGAAFGAKLLIGTKQAQGPLYKSWHDLLSGFNTVAAQAVQPLVGPFKDAFKSLGGFAKSMEPTFKSLFTAIGPAIKPLVTGLESLVKNVMPGLLSMLNKSGPAMQTFGSLFGTIGTAVSKTFTAFAKSGGITASAKAIANVTTALVSLAPTIATLAGGVAKFIAAIPPNVLGAVAIGITTIVGAVKVWTIAQAALDFVLAANPIGLVVIALAALAAGLIYAYKHSQTFRNIVTGALNGVKDAASTVARFFTKTVPTAFRLFENVAKVAFLEVELHALQFVYDVTGIMGKLPGPLGAPFRAAHKSIGADLARIQANVRTAVAQINGDWNSLVNPHVTLSYSLVQTAAGRAANAIIHPRVKFDSGGIANGLGFMPKATIKPERVLSPQQTASFDRLVDAIDGKAAARQPSVKRVAGRVDFDPAKSEIWFRDLATQEAQGEIRFAQGR